MANLLNWKDEVWLEAEAELDAARKMPVGPERFEALKRAGILRSEACKKMLEKEVKAGRALTRNTAGE